MKDFLKNAKMVIIVNFSKALWMKSKKTIIKIYEKFFKYNKINK